MEYLHHFALAEDPFRSDPLEKFDLELPSQQAAFARLDRGVRQGKGLLVLVGGVGAGKTRVARQLYEELEEELFEAGMMVVLRRQPNPAWLLTRFARQLGVEEPESEHEALISQIYERLAITHEDGRRTVLIVDDAHSLASAEVLSEVCGLVKLEYEDRRLLTVVLAGASSLDALLCADPLLAHHVDVKVHLAPLSREEAAGYVAGRIQAAQGDPQIVLPGAVAALHELAEGAPGRLNVLSDNALYEAFAAQRSQVTRADVERAYRDLGWADVRTPGGPADEARPPARRAGAAPAAEGARSERIALAEQTVMAPATDLDRELEAVFEGDPAGTSSATVVMGRDTSPPLEAPPKQSDEVDDLFVELLDD